MSYKFPDYLSPSSIGTFLQCPLKFKFSRIDGEREPPTEATLMGNLVHDVLENLYLDSPQNRTLQNARSLARKLWDEVYGDQVANVVRANMLNDFRWKAWFCIENLWKIEQPETKHFAGVEYELNTDFDGVAIKGFIDRFSVNNDGNIEVGDYKTGKVPSSKWEDDKFFQLFIYAAALQRLNVGKVDKVELIYLKGPKVISRQVNEENLSDTIETITNVRKQIELRCEAEEFEYKKSALCSWCYFKPKCPAWNGSKQND